MAFPKLTETTPLISRQKGERERGFFDGQFLIAMPGMLDNTFSRTVVYVCAHSQAGAMGFILNRGQGITFPEVLLHLKMIDQTDAIMLPRKTKEFPIQQGGPVETGRGFVLHSDDYISESSIPVSEDICLTATLDIVRAISSSMVPNGRPCCSVMPDGVPGNWKRKSPPMAGCIQRLPKS